MRQDEPNTPMEHAHLMRSGAFDNFWVLERVLGSEAGFVAAKKNSKNGSTCAVGDHCETKTLKFAGLLMAIGWPGLKS